MGSTTKKNKKNFYRNLNDKNFTNKIFWKALKPMLLNKSVSSQKNNLSRKSENSHDWERDSENFKWFLLKHY